MKVQKKIFTIVILSISILFGVFVSKNYAENETNEEESDYVVEEISTNTTNTTSTTTTTTNTATEKSSNANLSDLGITPYDFIGFKYGTTYYEVTVPEDTETVEVYAKTQNAKATLTGTGKKNLEKGENKVEVVVTAENGTKKTYTINIIREVQQENYEETEEVVELTGGLSELKINDLSLSPEFKTDIYEYTVRYIGEDTKLRIETKATNANYVIEVIGNEDLQEGENTITILVSESNGENVATYQITVNKSLIDEEAIAREEAEKKERNQKIMIAVAIAVIIVFIIIVIIVRRRRNRKIAEEFSGISFYENEDNDYEDDYKEEYEEDEIKEMPKDKIKEKFLNNYSNYEEEYEEEDKESKRKARHKGKRFK